MKLSVLIVNLLLESIHYLGSISTYILPPDPEAENNQAWRKGRSGGEGSMGGVGKGGHL